MFGIACTELTALLSRRSVYCAKNASSEHSVVHFDHPEGNILYSEHQHTWQKGRCLYCGASKEVYDRVEGRELYAFPFIHTDNPENFFNMDFDVIIGNPPYQLKDGGHGASAIPLYHLFVQQAMKLNPKYLCMIIQARWYAGGRGLDAFRTTMLGNKQLRVIHDFYDSTECFPGVDLSGGVCYFLWDRDYKGDCEIVSVINGEETKAIRPLIEMGLDVFIRFNQSISIIRKVKGKNEPLFSNLVSSQKPFGLRTYVQGHSSKKSGDVLLYSNKIKMQI